MRARGFTLLELIVVIAIFGLMSVMAYGGLSSVLKTRVHVEKSLERTGEYQKAFMRMRNDFQQVHYRAVRDGFGTTQPAFIGDTYSHVTFTRGGWRNPLSQPRASLERVVYYLDTDKKALMRSSFRALDQSQDSKPVEVALLENVTELNWRYLDKSREWQANWPPASASSSTSSTTTPAPPLAVEITLRTDDMGELRFLFNLGLDQRPPSFQAGLNPSGNGGTDNGGDGGKKDDEENNQPVTD
ncbi:MAG: type II secretion system minor pseudopilin GspJ [Pseudomonadota bacterium]